MKKLGDLMMILDLHRQGLKVAVIARQVGVDRKTVRKYIARGLEVPTYGPRQPRDRVLDPWLEYLKARLEAYPGLSAQRLLREISERGYTGGYSTVRDTVRALRPAGGGSSFALRFETPPGQQAQVDFAQFRVRFTSAPDSVQIVWLFSMVLGFSRLIWGRFAQRQTMQTVLACHRAAFEAIGGVPREIRYDRMKTAVLGEDERMNSLLPDPTASLLDRIKISMVGLRMPRAIEVVDTCVARLDRGEITALEVLEQILLEELTFREDRRIRTALRMGRLNTVKTLTGYDFSFQPLLDKARILALAELNFVARCEVVHLLGPPGTGKSHLASALGLEAVKAGKSVSFITLADLIGALAKAEREGTLRERIRFYCRPSLLIVDEIGYLPVIPGGGNLFFQLVNARYEKGAMILTSNRGFAEWGEIFGSPVVATALLDRLLHHAIVIQIDGSSYRLRRHADLLPEHVRSTARITPPAPSEPRRRGRPPKNGGAPMPNA